MQCDDGTVTPLRFSPLLLFTLVGARDGHYLIVPVEQPHHMTTQQVTYRRREGTSLVCFHIKEHLNAVCDESQSMIHQHFKYFLYMNGKVIMEF